jgi:hypothetical protein
MMDGYGGEIKVGIEAFNAAAKLYARGQVNTYLQAVGSTQSEYHSPAIRY